MARPALVVIGGSAGALSALLELVPTLPPTFPAPLLLTVHTSPDHTSVLPQLLSRAGPLPARHARHGDRLEPGVIFVAPPNHHLLVVDQHLHLSQGPKENHARPAIDVLFRSAAEAYTTGVIGVLLSGMLNDGASGLWTIERLGGNVLVQHPEDAEYPEMPLNALRRVVAQEVLRARDIGPCLVEWLQRPPTPRGGRPMNEEERHRLLAEIRTSAGQGTFAEGFQLMGPPSTLTCPECHGVLGQIEEGGRTRFRCHTGHAFTAEVLLAVLQVSAEKALWNAVRVLDEQVIVLDRLSGEDEAGRGTAQGARARQLEARANKLREFIQQPEGDPAET